ACGMSWFRRRGLERANARALLGTVGLSDRLGHRPGQLSGGEQQRVAIARALISRPAALLADEPTGNLDRKTGAEVLELLLELAQENHTAVLLATHDPEIAARCSRVLHLEEGRVRQE
ncbi:MAG: ATP-binding cassette domain-containing protein, partial [Planctomycetes bacterium]|nr:ATP-binding cassette domain-containing protein [Planctomycetota bacterium]